MASTKSRKPGRPQPVRSEAQPPTFYELRVSPFLEKYAVILALCLVAIGSIRITATYARLSLTIDEPGHFACGLQFLEKHVYRYESQHPPLARTMSALGPYLDGARLRGDAPQNSEGVDVILHSPNPQRTVTLMRLGILPSFWLAGVVVFVWARRIGRGPLAVIATGLFTMIPTVLAHSGLATTDMALASWSGAAFLSLLLWAESPTWKYSLLLGVSTALAALSKFTALGFLPAAALLALAFYIAVKKPGWKQLAALARARAVGFALAVLTGAVVIWAGYWFSYGRVPTWTLSLPAPEFFDGISAALRHNREGHPTYLLGARSVKGWWYYFPVLLAVKTPIALLLLIGAGLWHCAKRSDRLPCLMPVAFSFAILVTAMSGNVNIGLRHILPVYIGFAIVAAMALEQLARGAAVPRIAGVLLVLWIAAAGAIHHPDYLSYFNEFVGSQPEKVALDSDLDWGQDLIRLSKRLRDLGVKEVAISRVGESALSQVYGLPKCVPVDLSAPTEAWTVIRPGDLGDPALTVRRSVVLGGHDMSDLKTAGATGAVIRPWYERVDPTELVGTLRLYKSNR